MTVFFKIFRFFIAQFKNWYYLCTAFFGRVADKMLKKLL